MVERLQEKKKNIAFVDLDGTLLTCNSMREFMKTLPIDLLRKKKYIEMLRTLFWIGVRSFHLVSHKRMKWHLIKIARRCFRPLDWQFFSESLLKHLNRNVTEILENLKKRGVLIYIATAAPEEYAIYLVGSLKYQGAIATLFTPCINDYTEARGEVKLNKIKEIIAECNGYLQCFLTDHSDDFPTVEAFTERSLIVNPSKEDGELFRSLGVTRFIG